MMNAVDSRRNDHQVQNPLDYNRQPPIGMMKECRSLECNEEHDEHQRCNAEEQHCKRKKSGGKNHFAKVKSSGGAHVEIKVGVMHVMKTPEDRHHVIRPMPPPVDVIHHEKSGDYCEPSR